MEKWVRGLSKTTALIIGIVSLAAVLVFGIILNNILSGLIPLLILCAVVGGGIGFAFPLVYKGITGQTPLEKKEAEKR